MKTEKHNFYSKNSHNLHDLNDIKFDIFRIIFSFAVLSALLFVKNIVEKTVTGKYAFIVGEVLYIVAYLIPCAFIYKKREREKVFRQGDGVPSVAFSILFCALCFSLTTLFSFFLSELGVPFSCSDAGYLPDSFSYVLIMIILHALIPAVLEETYFRLFLTRATYHYGEIFSMLVSSALFSLAHLGKAGDAIYSFGAGILLWILYRISKKIVYPIISHFLVNAFSVMSVFFSKSHNTTAIIVLTFFSIVSSFAIMLSNTDIKKHCYRIYRKRLR